MGRGAGRSGNSRPLHVLLFYLCLGVLRSYIPNHLFGGVLLSVVQDKVVNSRRLSSIPLTPEGAHNLSFLYLRRCMLLKASRRTCGTRILGSSDLPLRCACGVYSLGRLATCFTHWAFPFLKASLRPTSSWGLAAGPGVMLSRFQPGLSPWGEAPILTIQGVLGSVQPGSFGPSVRRLLLAGLGLRVVAVLREDQ